MTAEVGIVLHVPIQHVAAFQALARMDEADAKDLLGALHETAPHRLSEILSREAFAQSGKPVVAAIVSLHRVRKEYDLDAHQVANAVRRSPDLGLTEDDQAQLARRITAVLEAPSVVALGRATDLLLENERIYQSARILTDLRPLFGADASESPVAFVLQHTLKIEFEENGERHAVHVTLDSTDLERLADVIERGKHKDRALSGFASIAGLTQLEPWQIFGQEIT